jgi:hypothetical protein
MQKMTRRAADKKCSADLMAKHNEIKSPTSNAGNARALLCVYFLVNKQAKKDHSISHLCAKMMALL